MVHPTKLAYSFLIRGFLVMLSRCLGCPARKDVYFKEWIRLPAEWSGGCGRSAYICRPLSSIGCVRYLWPWGVNEIEIKTWWRRTRFWVGPLRSRPINIGFATVMSSNATCVIACSQMLLTCGETGVVADGWRLGGLVWVRSAWRITGSATKRE